MEYVNRGVRNYFSGLNYVMFTFSKSIGTKNVVQTPWHELEWLDVQTVCLHRHMLTGDMCVCFRIEPGIWTQPRTQELMQKLYGVLWRLAAPVVDLNGVPVLPDETFQLLPEEQNLLDEVRKIWHL